MLVGKFGKYWLGGIIWDEVGVINGFRKVEVVERKENWIYLSVFISFFNVEVVIFM